jgi:hypothetical protein
MSFLLFIKGGTVGWTYFHRSWTLKKITTNVQRFKYPIFNKAQSPITELFNYIVRILLASFVRDWYRNTKILNGMDRAPTFFHHFWFAHLTHARTTTVFTICGLTRHSPRNRWTSEQHLQEAEKRLEAAANNRPDPRIRERRLDRPPPLPWENPVWTTPEECEGRPRRPCFFSYKTAWR